VKLGLNYGHHDKSDILAACIANPDNIGLPANLSADTIYPPKQCEGGNPEGM